MLDQRLDEPRHGVFGRHDRRGDAELLRRFGGHRSDRRDHGAGQQVGRLFLAERLDEVAHRRRAGERDGVDLPLEQQLVDVGIAFTLRLGGERAVGDDVGDQRAGLAQVVGQHLARDLGSREEHLGALELGVRAHRLDGALGAMLARHHVDLQAVARQLVGGRRADGADARPLQGADVAGAFHDAPHEVIDAVLAREHQPVEVRGRARTASSSAAVSATGTMRTAAPSIACAPSSSSRSTSSIACSRARVTTMRLPNSGRASNQRRCSRSPATLPMMTIDDPRRGSPATRRASSPSVPVMVRCDGSVPSWTIAAGSVLGASAVEHRLQDRRHLPRAGVADDRAAEVRQRHPVDLGRRLAAVLEALHEGHRLAGAGIGHRHAGVGRHRDAGRQAGHDLEGDALLVQEDRFLAAAVEEERIAPLEADDDLALAGLLGRRAGRSRPARRAAGRRRRRRCARRAAGAIDSRRGWTRWS